MFLTKTVKWKRTFHVVQLMASDWWDASSIANIQVYTRCRKWVFAFSFACIYLLAFTCTNSWTEIYKFGKYDVVQMLILFHHKNLVLVQHTESTLSIVYLLLQQLISLRSKHLCKKICLCFWTNIRSKMKIYFDHRLMRDGKYDFKEWFSIANIPVLYIWCEHSILNKMSDNYDVLVNFMYNWLIKWHRNIWDFLYQNNLVGANEFQKTWPFKFLWVLFVFVHSNLRFSWWKSTGFLRKIKSCGRWWNIDVCYIWESGFPRTFSAEQFLHTHYSDP